MRFSYYQIMATMERTGMIPVFYHSDVEIAKAVIDASYNAGIKVFEFTNRGENALEVFKELAVHSQKYPDLILGIGTIFSVTDAEKFLESGADFVVSPAFIPSIAAYCNGKDVLWVPGCGTVTEIFNARELGAKVIKAFPGNVLGPAFISSVKAVFPDIQMMPTGGVEPNRENLKGWFDAGVVCVGMGSQLFKKEWIKNRDFKTMEGQIAKTLETIQSIR